MVTQKSPDDKSECLLLSPERPRGRSDSSDRSGRSERSLSRERREKKRSGKRGQGGSERERMVRMNNSHSMLILRTVPL